MYTEHFNAIKTLVEQSSIDVKEIDWYNNQYTRYEKLKANLFPACYVEFPSSIKWIELGNKVQSAEVRIIMHLVFFDVKDDISPTLIKGKDFNTDISGKALLQNDIQLSTTLVKSSTELLIEYDQLKVFKIGYDCTIYDCSSIDELPDVNNVEFSIS